MNQEVGIVKEVKDFLILLEGLPEVKVGEIVENESGVKCLVNTLLPNAVEVLQLTTGSVNPKQVFARTGRNVSIVASKNLLGRTINPLGEQLDRLGPIKISANETSDINKSAYGIEHREFIKEQFDTGTTLIDTLIPIGKGQRELVVGDARSGKTSFLIDVIVNQKHTNVICIYAIIGKPLGDVEQLISKLKTSHALEHTIIVAATSNDLPPLIHIAPKAAMSIAEYFSAQGKDVLLILDDLGIHAKIYREISLLGNRPPGRESYPGDIFYQHAHILERAGNFNQSVGNGSITALPTIEINLNDLTTFVPTNLMAMTDGHLLFRASISNQGRRPAVDIGLSVSRVGRQTQNRVQNALSTRIRQVLAKADQLETVSRFSFELPQETQVTLRQKDLIMELIKQDPLSYIPKEIQTVLLSLPFTKLAQENSLEFIRHNHNSIIKAFYDDSMLSSISKSSFQASSDQALINQLETLINYIQGIANRKLDHQISNETADKMEK
jgi:F-type H+-transporting ATPase subunit alpha